MFKDFNYDVTVKNSSLVIIVRRISEAILLLEVMLKISKIRSIIVRRGVVFRKI
jgi:hypothetical protein